MIRFKNSNGNIVNLEKKSFAKGSEGSVHKVISTCSTNKLVAKIYHAHKKNKHYLEKKLKYMVANPPVMKTNKLLDYAIVWPNELIYDSTGDFVGYTMKHIENAITLTSLTVYSKSLKKHPLYQKQEWKKYHFENRNSHLLRIDICYRLARALKKVHESGNYILVDMKPDNIMVNSKGFPSIIDLDSIQITEFGKVYHHAECLTPLYVPAEGQVDKFSPKILKIEESFDNFSLAVIIYQVLFGIHPFVGAHKNKYTENEQLIKYGKFPNGKFKKEFNIIPQIHNNFFKADKKIQSLFLKSFDEGFLKPTARPSAKEIGDTLLNVRSKKSTGNVKFGRSVKKTIFKKFIKKHNKLNQGKHNRSASKYQQNNQNKNPINITNAKQKISIFKFNKVFTYIANLIKKSNKIKPKKKKYVKLNISNIVKFNILNTINLDLKQVIKIGRSNITKIDRVNVVNLIYTNLIQLKSKNISKLDTSNLKKLKSQEGTKFNKKNLIQLHSEQDVKLNILNTIKLNSAISLNIDKKNLIQLYKKRFTVIASTIR